MCSSGGSRQQPQAVQAPPPPPPAPAADSKQAKFAVDAAQARTGAKVAAARGRGSTLLTGPLGLQEDAKTTKKTLLGE